MGDFQNSVTYSSEARNVIRQAVVDTGGLQWFQLNPLNLFTIHVSDKITNCYT